ncbi:MAG: sulfurtransferase [Spirochaetales bacterium]|nr:sulfurtransferase [Spirochaetales bacterium]
MTLNAYWRSGPARAALILGILGILGLSSCAPKPAGETGTEIVEAKEVAALLAQSGTVLVDARNLPDYRETHITGAVNISRVDIVVNQPIPGLLAPADQIARVMGTRGISNDTMVVIYDDNNNMDSARLWWTLKIYGHDQVKVVSGGMKALLAEGYAQDSATVSLSRATFTPATRRDEMLITAPEIRRYINEPNLQVGLIDVRTDDEWAAGFIPGAVHINYIENNFRDGTFRTVQHIQIKYLGAGFDYDTEVILYCQTSIRAAQTYLAMYNAGYRNLRLYDGAWAEWSANPMNPIVKPEVQTQVLQPADQS